MPLFDQPLLVVSFSIAFLMLLLKTYIDLAAQTLQVDDAGNESDEDMNDSLPEDDGVLDMAMLTADILNTY